VSICEQQAVPLEAEKLYLVPSLHVMTQLPAWAFESQAREMRVTRPKVRRMFFMGSSF
jgi:hypothetical protein